MTLADFEPIDEDLFNEEEDEEEDDWEDDEYAY